MISRTTLECQRRYQHLKVIRGARGANRGIRDTIHCRNKTLYVIGWRMEMFKGLVGDMGTHFILLNVTYSYLVC